MNTNADTIQLAVAGGVAWITLNRPEALNALAGDMRERLIAALDRVAADPGARALVITGAGRGFCAGGDIRAMAEMRERSATFEELLPLMVAGRAIVTRLAALPMPVLAAVNGPAAGAGLNLALGCDIRWASERATFGATFVRIGLHPDWGGTYTLPRLVGPAHAMELCWTGDVIDAAEALRIGLVNRVIAHDAFEPEVRAFAARLAAAPRESVRLAKRSLRASLDRSLGECLDAEAEAQWRCWQSADVTEGLSAFVEKRAPAFGGAAAPSHAEAAAGRFE